LPIREKILCETTCKVSGVRGWMRLCGSLSKKKKYGKEKYYFIRELSYSDSSRKGLQTDYIYEPLEPCHNFEV
jgi:hypothetical protein